MRNVFITLTASLLLLSLNAFAGETEFCEILVPNKKIIDYNQGTIEAWFKLNYKLNESFNTGNNSYAECINFFSTEHSNRKLGERPPSEPNLMLRMAYTQKGQRLTLGSNMFNHKSKSRGVLYVPAAKLGLTETNETDWHYIAASWEKKGEGFDLKIYFNGKLTAQKTLPYRQSVKMKSSGKEVLRVGNVLMCYGSIDSFRLSQTVRTGEEIQAVYKDGLKKDKDSTLFLDYATIKKLKKVRFKEDKLPKVSTKGIIHGTATYVDGRTSKNKGISFNSK